MSSASISSEGSSLKTAATYIYDRLITRRFDPARRALADSTNRAATPQLSAERAKRKPSGGCGKR